MTNTFHQFVAGQKRHAFVVIADYDTTWQCMTYNQKLLSLEVKHYREICQQIQHAAVQTVPKLHECSPVDKSRDTLVEQLSLKYLYNQYTASSKRSGINANKLTGLCVTASHQTAKSLSLLAAVSNRTDKTQNILHKKKKKFIYNKNKLL